MSDLIRHTNSYLSLLSDILPLQREDTASATDHTIWYAVRFALANPFLSYSSVRFHQPRTLCEISYEVLSLLNDLTFLCFLSCFDFSMVKR